MVEHKLTEEELQKIQTVQAKSSNIVQEFGQIEISKRQLKAREQAAQTFYENLQSEESELVKELNEKYGNGSIDLEKGIFTGEDKVEDVEAIETVD